MSIIAKKTVQFPVTGFLPKTRLATPSRNCLQRQPSFLLSRQFFQVDAVSSQTTLRGDVGRRRSSRLCRFAFCTKREGTQTDSQVKVCPTVLDRCTRRCLTTSFIHHNFSRLCNSFLPLRMNREESNINLKLATALSVLKSRKTDRSEIVGVSVFGRFDFFEKFVRFRRDMLGLNTIDMEGGKRRLGCSGSRGDSFYCVKLDVKDCYQSINQARLSNILNGILGVRLVHFKNIINTI